MILTVATVSIYPKLHAPELEQSNKSLVCPGELSSLVVLGVPVSLITMETAVQTILRWIEN